MEPTSLSKDLYQEVILDDNYIDTVDHPNTFLDFDYATRVATPEQITSALMRWANQSDKLNELLVLGLRSSLQLFLQLDYATL